MGSSSAVREQAATIKVASLRLCELITEACPLNGRIHKAVDSIRAGTRIAIEELDTLGGDPGEPRARRARTRE